MDEKTSIPFTYLTKNIMARFTNIIVVAMDFWDNYIPVAQRFKLLLDGIDDESVAILLFNYPCQALSIADPAKPVTNYEAAKCIDQLLFYLDAEGSINLITDRLHMFGMGFGANVCLMYSRTDLIQLPSCETRISTAELSSC